MIEIPVATEAELVAWLIAFMTENYDFAALDLDPDRPFAEYGLDSVDAVIMAGAFDERFGVETDPALFLQNTDLRSLIDDLRAKGILASLGPAALQPPSRSR